MPTARALLELLKPRLTLLNVLSVFMGYHLGQRLSESDSPLGHLLIGAALLSGGSMAINQWLEAEYDARMARTAGRPLPDHRLSGFAALLSGSGLLLIGLLWLAWSVHLLAVAIGAAIAGLYVVAYTPAKRRTPLCTLIGAIPGALPPVMGYAAATGRLDAGAAVLFALLFTWQIPHFIALAWMYREDYARAGFQVLSVTHPRWCGRQSLLYSAALLAISTVPSAVGLTGSGYLIAAVLLSILLLVLAANFARRMDYSSARLLFAGSVLYLPLLLAAMLASPAPRREPVRSLSFATWPDTPCASSGDRPGSWR